MKDVITELIKEGIEAVFAKGICARVELPFIEVEASKDPAHGDYASNVAMILASRLKRNPRQIAGMLVNELDGKREIIEKIEIAGPGFINFFIRDDYWRSSLAKINNSGENYGVSNIGRGKRVLVEFVSANPTGPLHIGHARGAIVGDVIANIFARSGYAVSREYYINDAGNQMNNLGISVYLRYLEILGRKIELPQTAYQGDYIIDIARSILERDGPIHLVGPMEEKTPVFTDYAAQIILAGIKEDLAHAGVSFDRYFSERELYRKNAVLLVLEELEKAGHVYSDGETRWFRTTCFGDEKDRVVVRRNGEPTYFAADLAYHRDKMDRGFAGMIDIWGADHHGYIPRMKAGIQSLGGAEDALQVVLVQLVNLLRDGQPVAMSTRSGEFITMREVFDEVGRDAGRYNFLLRRSDSHLDFDLDLVKRQSNENPVYYVQYAHARIASILRLAEERGYHIPAGAEVDLCHLELPEEMALIKALVSYPDLLRGAATSLEPHRITFYLNDLAGSFHSYYNRNKVISDNKGLSLARLFLIKNIKIVLSNALVILGVAAPDRMDQQN
ncbi:MAG: arginine--tRNA ligase [Smithellaceae bacterium]|nr:arginine--tRNA ligase [Smithellaceae bacterium]